MLTKGSLIGKILVFLHSGYSSSAMWEGDCCGLKHRIINFNINTA